MDFSIVIPAKNEEASIGRCLDSILQLDYDRSDFEIIVVDNGSADATAEIATRLGAKVLRRPDATISALRNFGAAKAKGEILAFIDADCAVSRSWLKEAARYLPRTDIVCFGSPPRVPEGASWVQKAWYLVRRKRNPVGETPWLESMNMFIRRESFESCHGFDERLVTCEDYDISLRLASFGRIYADAGIVAVHYGEARDLRHFFRKERWRGISNLSGSLRHGVKLHELPSLCLPLLHCLLIAAVCVAPFAEVFHGGLAASALSLFLGWQLLLLALSFLRYYGGVASQVLQVFLLLNVYYVARGVAILR